MNSALLMEIPDREYLISASYQESLNSLINKISFFRKEAKEFVKSFINSPDSVDFNHLRNCFFWLESGKWVEKLREGIYSNEISGIEKEIKIILTNFYLKLKEINLGIQKLYPILQLKEFIPSLENYEKDIWIFLRKRVEETLKLIKREFNPELQDIEKENNDLKRLMSQEHKLDYALYHIKGTNLNKNELEDKYNEYNEHFGQLHRIYWRITSNEGVNSAISQILSQNEIESKNHVITSLNPDINLIKNFIPELLAHIAMLWVLLNIKKYNQDVNDEDQEINMVTPHTMQVLSIFRMIGIGYEENTKSKNSLVQILTGEGKSITLAFLCSMLALLGFSVNCACYSEHLSNRDFQDFQPLYTALNVYHM